MKSQASPDSKSRLQVQTPSFDSIDSKWVLQVQTPDLKSGQQSADTRLLSPDSWLQTPSHDSKRRLQVQTPDSKSGLQVPKSGFQVRTPDSQFHTIDSQVQIPDSKSVSKTQFLDSRLQVQTSDYNLDSRLWTSALPSKDSTLEIWT